MGAVTKKSCLIVGAGEFTAAALARCGDTRNSLIIAADGGYLRCAELGLTPHLILGDFDSAPMPPQSEKTQVFPAHKDDTDCMLAAKEGLARGCDDFTLAGCTGGRLDHTMANLQTLVYLANHGCRAQMVDERHLLTVIVGSATLRVENTGGYLSLFSLGDSCTGVTLGGVEYPLMDAVLKNSFPLGVSNHIAADFCEITIKTGTLLIMTVLEGEQGI